MTPFGERLTAAVDKRGPLCVGIDPHPGLLSAWGLSLDADGVERFGRTVVDALADRIAVLKPQSAFFERYGSRGVAALERVIGAAREAGALVIADVKRGDIGSTAEAYAHAYLDPASPLFSDAMTASPYLGVGSLQPLFDTALANGAGVYVLALTSNPEGAQVQHARTEDGRSVAQRVFDEVSALNEGTKPLGSIGVVVGATIGATGHELSAVNGSFLAPGIGAQGGTAADLRTVFGENLHAVLPSVSREILGRGPDVRGLRDAAERSLESMRAVLS